jgi:hypothetical protein
LSFCALCKSQHFVRDKTLADIYHACQSRKAKCTPSNLSQQLNQPRRILFASLGDFCPFVSSFGTTADSRKRGKAAFRAL